MFARGLVALALFGSTSALGCGADSLPDALVVRVEAETIPSNTPEGDDIFVAGSFNGWKPDDASCRMVRNASGGAWIDVRLSPAQPTATFKFTRGSWSTVEKDADGFDVTDRKLSTENAVARFTVAQWADLARPPRSTITGDVTRLADFPMPQLGTTRGIWIYLPPGYHDSKTRYPVLYMFDGQNLFDRASSAFGSEWKVDETLQGLVAEGRAPAAIVVGLENSARRGCEYNVFAADPHPACSTGEALGSVTGEFVVNTLKPYIDTTYRTLPQREHTAIGGSSMGGQMALFLGLRWPEVFSRVAAFSPSFQNRATVPVEMVRFLNVSTEKLSLRISLDMGDAETIRELTSAQLVANLQAVGQALAPRMEDASELRVTTIPGGIHHESAWAERFGDVYSWVMAERHQK